MRALVTGATGSVGVELVSRLLADGGDSVEVHGTTRMMADREPDSVIWHQVDFCSSAESWDLPDDVDYLICAAGLPSGKELLHKVDPEEINSILAVNLIGPIALSQKYIPGMLSRKFGRIVFVNSIWGMRGSPANSIYNISKHGLTGLTRSIAKDYAQSGITANEVCPCAIDSRMLMKIAERVARDEGEPVADVLDSWRHAQVGGRFVTPSEVVNSIMHFLHDSTGALNGVSLPVDLGEIS